MDVSHAREHGLMRYFPASARAAARFTEAALDREPRPEFPAGEDLVCAIDWLGQMMSITAVCNGTDPALLDFGSGRGAEQARRLMSDGHVTACCDHCGQLLLMALVIGTAGLLLGLHGDKAAWHWQQLAAAMLPAEQLRVT